MNLMPIDLKIVEGIKQRYPQLMLYGVKRSKDTDNGYNIATGYEDLKIYKPLSIGEDRWVSAALSWVAEKYKVRVESEIVGWGISNTAEYGTVLSRTCTDEKQIALSVGFLSTI